MGITTAMRSVVFLQKISCVSLVAGGDSDCVGKRAIQIPVATGYENQDEKK